MSADDYSISGIWQTRGETAAEVVARVRRYFALVRPSLPPDLRWWMATDETHTSTFDPERDQAQLGDAIVLNKDRKDQKPAPYMGFPTYIFLASEDPCGKPARMAQLRLYAGASGFQGYYNFETDFYSAGKADPRLITYDALRANMMALIWAFQPEYSHVGPYRLNDYLDSEVYNRPYISLAWMIWLENSLAKQVDPPPRFWNTIVEPYSDGSLFMATGKEPFSCDIELHLRCARAIHRQIDFLNFVVPFEDKCGRNPSLRPSRYPPGCPY